MWPQIFLKNSQRGQGRGLDWEVWDHQSCDIKASPNSNSLLIPGASFCLACWLILHLHQRQGGLASSARIWITLCLLPHGLISKLEKQSWSWLFRSNTFMDIFNQKNVDMSLYRNVAWLMNKQVIWMIFLLQGNRKICPWWILLFNNKLLNQFTKIYLEESKSPHS